MATSTDIITRARQRLRIHADEEPLQAVDLEKGVHALNDMLYSWVQDKSIDGFKTGTADDIVHVVTKDGTTLTNEANSALIANLAVRLADDYSVPVSPVLMRDAVTGLNAIVAMGFLNTDVQSTFDPALSFMPSQRTGIHDLLDTSE